MVAHDVWVEKVVTLVEHGVFPGRHGNSVTAQCDGWLWFWGWADEILGRTECTHGDDGGRRVARGLSWLRIWVDRKNAWVNAGVLHVLIIGAAGI